MDRVREIEFVAYGVTNLHPIVIAFMLWMIVLAFSRQRTRVVLAVLAVCVFMPMEQRVVVGGLDFGMLRLFVIIVWIRILVKGEYRGLNLGKFDLLFVLWVFSASFFYVLREGPSGIVYRLGVIVDALTAFFLMRSLVRTRAEVLMFWKQLARIAIVLGPFLLYEAIAKYNVFGILEYAGFDVVEVRNGRARAQGPFSHPILAGTFGSVLMPVFVGVFLGWKSQRKLFAAAAVGATIVTLASSSSGPAIAWAAGVFGWAIWRFRRHVRLMLWSILGLAVVIHLVREKPVWHLILRLSSVTGGTGHHRYYLVDAFIRRFGEWALMGTSNTAHWGWGLQDTTNRYVAEGVSGGLVTLVLFLVVLMTSFVQLRRVREVYERRDGSKSIWALLAWGSSVSLAVHCVSFISVSYFGQMVQFFIFFIATVPAFSGVKRRRPAASPAARIRARSRVPMPAA